GPLPFRLPTTGEEVTTSLLAAVQLVPPLAFIDLTEPPFQSLRDPAPPVESLAAMMCWALSTFAIAAVAKVVSAVCWGHPDSVAPFEGSSAWSDWLIPPTTISFEPLPGLPIVGEAKIGGCGP